jgi:hypothetical protein
MARNYEKHPVTEAIYDFGVFALLLGGIAVLGAGLEVL